VRAERAGRRGGGRHRLGAQCLPWTSIRWDVRQRADAAGLDLLEPRWLVIYRPWARSFYAVPAWPLAGEAGVEAVTIAGLRERMRQAEAESFAEARGRTGTEGATALGGRGRRER
jgi:hypothetical protein